MSEEIATIQTHEVELASYITIGNFDKAVEVLSKSPEAFSSFIKITGEGITKSREKAQEIKDRNFIKKLFSSNSTDLAKIVLDQNETLSNFFVILQLLTLSTKGNIKLLSDICMSIRRMDNIGDSEQENLNKMAIAFLEQNIESIKQDELRDKALLKLLKAAEITDQFETRMSGDVARVEKTCEDFQSNVKQQLSDINNVINDKEKSLTEKIEEGERRVENKISDESSKISSELSTYPERLTKQEELIARKEQILNEQINHLKKILVVISIVSVIAVICAVLGVIL